MDKITDAFSHKVQSSPARTRARAAAVTPKSSPRRSNQPQHEVPYSWGTSPEPSPGMNSPTFSDLMPGHQQIPTNDIFSGNLAERRHKAPPPPLQLGGGRRNANGPQRPEMESVNDSVSPLSQSQYEGSRFTDDDPESLYSQDTRYIVHPGPLDLRGTNHRRSRSKLNDAVVDAYKDWAQIHTPSPPRDSSAHPENVTRKPRRSKSTGEGLRQSRTADTPLSVITPRDELRSETAPLFSPLQFYFRGPDFPMAKKGEKTMIGDNGWLERTDKVPDKTKKTPQKKVGIIEGIKKIAKDMAELHHNTRRPQHPIKERPSFQVAISLDSREQSLLYCELEYHLSSALNDYITVQLDKGRLVPDKLKRVADAWQHKGRPKVVGFRYDLETQLELVNLHVDDFRFYGRRQGDAVEISGLLHAMKVNGRAMSIRTFCQPDSVIAKQLVDTQSLFKLLGVPDVQQIALAEISQFFKVIIEREMDYRSQRESEGRRTKTSSHRQDDSQWQTRTTLRDGGMEG
ncbi:hypothetical protein G7Z17_g12251 [Cylindrodendrum hubeiense]|uniref:Uncharacterized protein n=1 Tax=Cylindrodendrum hubeiense TaxID=595255 RepID=A0A9P5H3G8_9HYPO|nr:hypothetical protein G7Z17_g12251 [Cylindrodendrum hubeiense]